MWLGLITRYTLLAVGILLNSSCAIGSYGPSEPTAKPAVQSSVERDFLFFSYIPISGDQQEINPRRLPWASQRVKGLLEQHSKFKTAIPTLSAPAIGTYITVYETARPYSRTFWCTVNLWTIFVVPCVDEFDAHETHFDVYVDNALKKSYRYNIHWKGVYWIGLVPFFWVNLFMTGLEEAFSANAHQFITDAKQDGFL